MPRIRTTTLAKRKSNGEPVAMLTAYDYPTARLMDATGVDCILVGDSCADNVMGLPDTLGITMDDMVHHVKMVTRAVRHALVIADMPFLSYQVSAEEAVRNAGRFVQEAGAQAVKLEGPVGRFGGAIEAILHAGIPVVGHIGLTPQSVNRIGGYKVQGRGEDAARILMEEALGLEAAGCFAIVLEMVAMPLAREITEALRVPTIGIGSGPHCDGQVLIAHDMLGINPERGYFKRYAQLDDAMKTAFESYVRDVKNRAFPGEEHGHT
jgi:3-methyl-2-oxobutanoate hydroxymethyltransferase